MATKKAEGWKLVPCVGDAHSNPHIDNCWACAPRWAVVVVPATCADVKAWHEMLRSAGMTQSGWTPTTPAYRSLKRRQKLADTRMRKAEEAAERAEWIRKDPEAAEFVLALKDAGVVK